MEKEAQICQTKYALNLIKNHDKRLIKFISKCPWMIKSLHLISAQKYYDKWEKCLKYDNNINLNIRYQDDIKKIHQIDMSVKFYKDFNTQFNHSPKKDMLNQKNAKIMLKKLLYDLTCPNFILEARKDDVQ